MRFHGRKSENWRSGLVTMCEVSVKTATGTGRGAGLSVKEQQIGELLALRGIDTACAGMVGSMMAGASVACGDLVMTVQDGRLVSRNRAASGWMATVAGDGSEEKDKRPREQDEAAFRGSGAPIGIVGTAVWYRKYPRWPERSALTVWYRIPAKYRHFRQCWPHTSRTVILTVLQVVPKWTVPAEDERE